MLSPRISTNSYGKRWCMSVHTLARRYWFESPVPLSPMTANVSVSFGLFGRVRSCAAPPAMSIAVSARAARRECGVRMSILELRNRIQHVVDNQVALSAQQDQVLADDSILQVFG